jgi:hypothetical protein
MAVYCGSGVEELVARTSGEIVWLQTAPVSGSPMWPLALDVAESALRHTSSELIQTACRALAPRWDELESYGLARPVLDLSHEHLEERAHLFLASYFDRGESSLSRYLSGGLATAVARLGRRYGVVLWNPHWCDNGSIDFILRLLREAAVYGLQVAILAPGSLAKHPKFQEPLRGADRVDGRTRRLPVSDGKDIISRIVALCPQGLPSQILSKLVGSFDSSGMRCCSGPDGECWVYLPRDQRRRVLSVIPLAEKRELHKRIFEAWEVTGWGYLRRGGQAIIANDSRLLLNGHCAYVNGMLTAAPWFVYLHLAALARCIEKDGLAAAAAAEILMTTAKMASTLGKHNELKKATMWARAALRSLWNDGDRLPVMAELANLYANLKDSKALRQAEQWCQRAARLAVSMENEGVRAQTQIRLVNIRALIEYHRQNDQVALALEREAKRIADNAAEQLPQVELWATPLLNRNTARLFSARLSDPTAAKKLLHENLERELSPLTRELDLRNLARLYFDERNYGKVVDLLSPLYERHVVGTYDEQEELFGRALFSLSLAALDEIGRARRQLARLEFLSRAAGSHGGTDLAAVLRKVVGPWTAQ